MFFSIKNINNTDIINIRAKKLEVSECLMLIKIIAKISKRRNRKIILNLNYILNLDNFFVERLIYCQKYCDKNNCIISFCRVKPDILSVFFLLKLDKYFEFYEDEYDAFLRKNRLIKRRLKAV